MSATAVGMFVC